MRTTANPDDYEWSPIFSRLTAPVEPQTGGSQSQHVPTNPAQDLAKPKAPASARTTKVTRLVEDLTTTNWVLVEPRADGIVLQDSPGDRWREQSLWVPCQDQERSYAIRFQALEYEFARVLATPKTFVQSRAKNRRLPAA